MVLASWSVSSDGGIRRKSKQMWSRGGWARNGWGRQQEQHLGLGVSCQLHWVPTAAVCCSSEKEQFLGFCDKEETIWWTGLAYGKASRGQHLPEPQVKFHSGSLYSPAPHCLQLWGSSNTLRMCFHSERVLSVLTNADKHRSMEPFALKIINPFQTSKPFPRHRKSN